MKKILKIGAEAVITLTYYDGKKSIEKKRIKKSYRHPDLDISLRVERTRKEAKLLREARAIGVLTPQLYHVDEKHATIFMQYIDGTTVKEKINGMKKKEVKELFKKIGVLIGKLHSAGIIHGDLTTSNMIISKDGLYFIDFGLGLFSRRIEDFGTDLKLLKEAIEATHPKLLNVCWKSIVNGYKKTFKYSSEVLKRVKEIEKRGRYVPKNDQRSKRK